MGNAAIELSEATQQPAVLTCTKGCGKCCEVAGTALQLLATKQEAMLIGDHIGRDPANISGRTIGQIQFGQINEKPCPFHVDRACSIYSVRPVVCQLYQCDLTDPSIKSGESLARIGQMLNEQIDKGTTFADLRTWFPDVER